MYMPCHQNSVLHFKTKPYVKKASGYMLIQLENIRITWRYFQKQNVKGYTWDSSVASSKRGMLLFLKNHINHW